MRAGYSCERSAPGWQYHTFVRPLIRLAASLAALGTLAMALPSELLGPGSPAPALDIKKWFKGKEVTEFEADKTYVVEFWATWCGPCRTSIPHITELAKKNPDVTFIGVGIWEEPDYEKISGFVEEMGENMDYSVAYSGNQEGMSQTWMRAAGQNGIPSAFIVRDRQIVWVGHPMSMDEPLKMAKAGTLDVAAEKKKHEDSVAESERQMAGSRAVSAANQLYTEGKTAEGKAALDKAVQDHPQVAQQARMIRMTWAAKDDQAQAEKWIAEAAASKSKEDLMFLAGFAMRAAKDPNASGLARKAMDAAVAASEGKDVLVNYYGMNVYEQFSEFKLAHDCATKGLAALPESEFKDNADLKKLFETKRDALAAKLRG
jgi:thiol-disulfide isomerase/thioredoxin